MENTAVCWDLDKTITNVSGLTDKLLQIVLGKYNIDFQKDYLSTFRCPELEGKPIEMRLKYLFGEKVGSQYFQDFKELKTKGNAVPPIFDGVIDVITSTSNLTHMLVTNKEFDLAMQDIQGNGIQGNFKKIVTAGDTYGDETKLKPSPYLLEFAVLGLQSKSIIMIGDTAADINALLSLKGENKMGLLVGWGNTSKTLEEQVKLIKGKEGSDYLIIPTPEEVKKYLISLN